MFSKLCRLSRKPVEVGSKTPQKAGVTHGRRGVVTLSLIDWNLPTTADFDAWDFSGLACRSVVHIGPNSLNVTMPRRQRRAALVDLHQHVRQIVDCNPVFCLRTVWRAHYDNTLVSVGVLPVQRLNADVNCAVAYRKGRQNKLPGKLVW